MLVNLGYEAELVQVIDANSIDREVHSYKPTHVVIEALWVTPQKLAELVKIYPSIKWIVRSHSETPFIANEGIAEQWLFDYRELFPHVILAMNSGRTAKEYESILKIPVITLPNYYPVNMNTYKPFNSFYRRGRKDFEREQVHIGCLGAIRPLKNQLIQAHAAIEFAESINKRLFFYINSTRQEQKGEQVYKNLVSLFENTPHELYLLPWLDHDKFIDFVEERLDLGMQCSLTESFNIVAADLVNVNIPIVVSKEVRWAANLYKCDPTSFEDIVDKLKMTWWLRNTPVNYLNKIKLYLFSKRSRKLWLELDCE